MEFFDSIIRILQLVLDVGFSSIIIIIRMIFRGVRQWILFWPFYTPISLCLLILFRNLAVNCLKRYGRLKWIFERIMFQTCVLISWRWLYVQDVPFHLIWIDCTCICLVLPDRNAVRMSFKLIDFSSRSSETLKALILHSVAMESFITHTHGKKLLSM